MLCVCKTSRCVIKPELCQALSKLSLQGILLWQQRLPLSVVLLLLINPLQCSPACLNVLQWYALVLGSMHLLDSYPKTNIWKHTSQRYLPLAPVHAEQVPACRMQACMTSFALRTTPDQSDRVGRLTCIPTCAGPEPVLAATAAMLPALQWMACLNGQRMSGRLFRGCLISCCCQQDVAPCSQWLLHWRLYRQHMI